MPVFLLMSLRLTGLSETDILLVSGITATCLNAVRVSICPRFHVSPVLLKF